MIKLLSLIIAIWAYNQTSQAENLSDLSQSCYQYNIDGYDTQVCIFSFPNSSKDTIVYHLHGGGQNALTWVKSKNFLRMKKEWKRQDLIPPTFITISFGPIWLLKDFTLDGKKPLIKVYNELQANIEKNLFKVTSVAIKTRIILGESWGGVNAILALALGDKNIIYHKAAILCAAVATLGPYATESDIQTYMKRNSNSSINHDSIAEILVNLPGREFPTRELWEKNDFIKLFAKIPTEPRQIYISTGTDDLLGLEEGNKILAETARQQHRSVEFKLVESGQHCEHDFSSLANFLSEADSN